MGHERTTMPKMKTHKGAAKRFRKTKNRKVKRWKAGRRHLLSGKDRKRLRNLGQPALCSPADRQKLLHLLG